MAVICLAGKFIDFYVVLGVRADASQEEIWAAYNRNKGEAASLGHNALGTSTRERLMEAAIAVLGSEDRRMAYDFNGVGGTVDFEVHPDDLSPPETFGMSAAGHQAQAKQPWSGYGEGSVIQGSNRGGTTASAPQQDQPVQPPQPVAQPQPIQAAPVLQPTPSFQPDPPVQPVPPAQQPQFSQAYDQMQQMGQQASQDAGFALRTTANVGGGGTWEGQDFARPRPYRQPVETKVEEESPLSLLLSKATFTVGAVFALLLSIAWMLELPLIGGFLSAGTVSLLKRFLVAANEAHIVKLWVVVFAGGYLLWCVELFAILFATSALDASYDSLPAVRQREAQKRRGQLLGAEVFLFLALFASVAAAPGNMNFMNNPKVMWALVRSFLSLFYFFLPLFLVVKLAGRSVWSAVVWQVFLLAGHMLFVLVLERILLGSMSITHYFTGGLFKFGYASWWILFFFGYKGFERMNAR